MQIVSQETICMKYQSLFSGKTKTNNISLSSAEFAHMSGLSDIWLTLCPVMGVYNKSQVGVVSS